MIRANCRLVSLVPSLSKTVVAAGLQAHLVGCTKFCVDPPDLYRSAQVVGGTKDPDLLAIARLAPDFVLVNDEENRAADIEALAARGLAVIRTAPKSPEDVLGMFDHLGVSLATAAFAPLAAELRAALAQLPERPAKPPRFLYFIWQDPYMVAGRDTYISRLLTMCGLENAAPAGDRYPTLAASAIAGCQADMWLLASEPYPFRRRDAAPLLAATATVAGTVGVFKMDGKLASWWGSLTAPALRTMAGSAGGYFWGLPRLA